MIYEAKYIGQAYYEAMADVAAWAASDNYYRNCGATIDLGRCGCTGTRAGESLIPSVENVLECETAQWLSCAGNLLRYSFDHSARTVTILVDSRRHGIPSNRFRGNYNWQRPDQVIRYETQEPDWEWWETADTTSAA